MGAYVMAAKAAPIAVRLNPMHHGRFDVSQGLCWTLIVLGALVVLASLAFTRRTWQCIVGAGLGLAVVASGVICFAIGTYPTPKDSSAVRSSLESAYKVKIKNDGGIFDGVAKNGVDGVDAADVSFIGNDGILHTGQLSRKGMDFTLYVGDGKGGLVPYTRSGLVHATPDAPTVAYDYAGHKGK